jgi:hypothetical protein
VYYYPWYKDDFHKGDGYVRKQLTPPQQPWLGEYDGSDPWMISIHLVQWSCQSNINLWVSSWWGEGSREDTTLKNTIFTHGELGSHQLVVPDIKYICEEYFNYPNYFVWTVSPFCLYT